MPVEVFGPGYAFLPKSEVLTFGEMVRTVKASVELGVKKVRLTGGEPLMRRGVEDLVTRIAAVNGVEDVAMTTNGILLNHHAENLKLAGLSRVTVSLDALDGEIFATMNGVGAKVERVLAGIDTALQYGLPVKVNMVATNSAAKNNFIVFIILRFVSISARAEVILKVFVIEMCFCHFNLWNRIRSYRGCVPFGECCSSPCRSNRIHQRRFLPLL